MSGKIALKIVKNLFFLIIGLLLLYLAFRGNDLDELFRDLKNAKYSWALLSVVFGVGAFIARGIRWTLLLEPLGYKARVSTSVYSIIIGYLANLAIPRIGEITRCTAMRQAENIPVNRLFGTVILERIIDVLLLVFFTVLTILLKVDLFGGFFLDLIKVNKDKYPGLAIAGGIAILFGCLLIVFLYLVRSRLIKFNVVRKLREFFLGLKEGLSSIRKIKRKAMFFFLTFLIWLFYYLMTYVVFFSVKETSHLGLIDGFFILVVGGFGMAAPVQGGIGAYHLIVSMGLGVLGVPREEALTYATIVHTIQTILVLFTGMISLGLISMAAKNPSSQKVHL